jgi:hypothetical protein
MNGRYANPYKQAGNSVAGILDTFMNRGGIQQQGYLDASKSMADIEQTRASTQKILAELARNRAADKIGPEQLAIGPTPDDWKAQKMYETQGMYGTTPYQPSPDETFGPGDQLPPGLMNAVTQRPASLTDADLGAMQRARTVDAILKKTGDSGTGMKAIMEALAGPQSSMAGLGGPAGMSDDVVGFIKDVLPIDVRAVAIRYLNQPGKENDMMGALGAALAKADEATKGQILQFLAALPMATMDTKLTTDPDAAMQGYAGLLNSAGRYMNNPNAAPQGQGYDYEFVPGQGLVPAR